ncbi:MAG: hypothetical protein LIO99_06140 [Clostridiales bacterium]|nr:hypothetical protein [Clostridiales bacterium]
MFKNMTETVATVGGGTGGWIAGASAGSMLLPGIGTVVGGILGSIVGGASAGTVANKVTSAFIEDDAEAMVGIIQNVFTDMASEYLLNNKEAEKVVDKLRDELDGKKLKDMFASQNRRKFARILLTPIIENEVAKRNVVYSPTTEQMKNSLELVLNEIYDETSSDGHLSFA